MEEYLSEKYEHVLDVEDVEELFNNLTKVYGSIQKTAEKCEVARTTPYGWREANYVKAETRKKVLQTSLKTNRIKTLELLTAKSKNQTADILLTYLSAIHQEAIDAQQNNFVNLLNQFFTVRNKYSGLIRDTLNKEVSLMSETFIAKAKRLHIPFPEEELQNIEPKYMLEIMPHIIDDLVLKKIDPNEITKRYGIPIEIPVDIKTALEPITSRPKAIAGQNIVDYWTSHQQLRKAQAFSFEDLGIDTYKTRSTEDPIIGR